MADSDVKLDLSKLNEIVKILGANAPYAKVGILGPKAQRTEGKKTLTYAEVMGLGKKIKYSSNSKPPLTNVEIGMAHEFGVVSRGLPQRSFLRVPLTTKLAKAFENQISLAYAKQVFDQVIATKSLLPWVKMMAVLAEGVVLGGFASGGYGKWKKWKKGYTNNTGNILVDTQQLRNSISFEIVGGAT